MKLKFPHFCLFVAHFGVFSPDSCSFSGFCFEVSLHPWILLSQCWTHFLCSIIIGCEVFRCAHCILAPTRDTGVSAAWYGAQSHSHSLDLGCPSSIPICGGVPCTALCQSSSLLRHFHSVHIRSAPGGSSSQGLSVIGETGERSDTLTVNLTT